MEGRILVSTDQSSGQTPVRQNCSRRWGGAGKTETARAFASGVKTQVLILVCTFSLAETMSTSTASMKPSAGFARGRSTTVVPPVVGAGQLLPNHCDASATDKRARSAAGSAQFGLKAAGWAAYSPE